ncbi:MAG: cytochrome d ubiquinol oxidase subunit II, partial [Longimicrobiales bacterium]|nr:cytochrome d ubiquinol oxidase subunit II [Longimicrobiales bacterium]
MTLPDVMAAIILVVLMAYVLLGGADFGGGVWDLAARGPRSEKHREIIAHAIGPIWEANHVWMIVAVVLLFTCFPSAFAVIMTALHIPVTLMLIGIVLRGSSFIFRKVDPAGEGGPSGWQSVFAVSSLITPVMIGVVAGTVSTPVLGYENGVVTGGFFRPWLAPFPWVVGAFTLSLFAFLAAVYLTLEAEEPEIRDDFRVRALAAAAAVAVAGALAAALASAAAPELSARLTGTAVGRAVVAAGLLCLGGAAASLVRRRYFAARALVVLTTLLVLAGWGWGLHPWIVVGAVQVHAGAAPDVTLRIVAWILAGGSVVLVPAYAYLYAT